ncbi:hypothetical protein J9100_002059 [Vibrio vulnificus]|nr:hypothetical protein [Vibrio vulnificus]
MNYEREREGIIFVELVNFIGHEVYRAALLTQYPDEYNRILGLNNEVISELKATNCNEMQYEIDELTYVIVNAIVLEYPYEKLREKINSIANRVYPDEFLDEDDILKEKLEVEIKRILQVAKRLYSSHTNWCTNIHHRCMPAGLMPVGDFEDVIAYIDSKGYIARKEMTADGELCETLTSPPVGSIMMFGDEPKYRIHSKKTDLVPIPETSLFDRYIRPDTPPKEKLKCNETQYKAMAHLSFIDNRITHVDFTHSLSVKIDLSSPMSKRELELFMSDIHQKITDHQNMNMNSAMLLAEDLEQLENVYKREDLGQFDLANHMSLTKYPIQGVSSFTDVKNALLGLMAWHEHFTKTGGDHTLIYEKASRHQDESFVAVSERFTNEDSGGVKKGFGLNTIKKGYSVISVAIQHELAKQRYGRYQERKMSTERKKALENAPTVSFSELHDNDKGAVNARLKSLKSRGYEGLIKQHADGSIWIVYFKK